jgi:hypothetical protein
MDYTTDIQDAPEMNDNDIENYLKNLNQPISESEVTQPPSRTPISVYN